MTLRSRVVALSSGTRFGRFLLVGGLGAVVDNAALVALHDGLGVALWLAKLGSAETAIVLMFLANEYWTFAAWGRTDPLALVARFLRSNLVRVGGLAVAWAVLLALAEWAGLWYVLANMVGIVVGFVVNYAFESLYTWKIGSEGSRMAP